MLFNLKKSSLYGGFILIISIVSMSIGNSFVHSLSTKYSAFSILFYKSIFALLLLLILQPSLSDFKKGLVASKPLYNVLRAIIGTLGVLLWIPSVQNLTLHEVSALSLTSSFFSAFGGYLFLKEKSTYQKNIALVIGFIGAYIIIHPHFEEGNWLYILPLGSALCFGASGVLARILALQDQEYITSFYLFGTMILVSLPFGLIIPATVNDGLILGCIGILYGASQILYVKAYKYGEASYLAGYKFLKVPLHSFFGVLFFMEIPSTFSILGTVVIIFSLILSSTSFKFIKRLY
jgi:S-adenosylmethionine uptake transporter